MKILFGINRGPAPGNVRPPNMGQQFPSNTGPGAPQSRFPSMGPPRPPMTNGSQDGQFGPPTSQVCLIKQFIQNFTSALGLCME